MGLRARDGLASKFIVLGAIIIIVGLSVTIYYVLTPPKPGIGTGDGFGMSGTISVNGTGIGTAVISVTNNRPYPMTNITASSAILLPHSSAFSFESGSQTFLVSATHPLPVGETANCTFATSVAVSANNSYTVGLNVILSNGDAMMQTLSITAS